MCTLGQKTSSCHEIHWYLNQFCNVKEDFFAHIYRMSQELRSVLQDLIPELMLSQKRYIHMDSIHNGSGVMSF